MIALSKLRRLFFGRPNAIQTAAGVRPLGFRSSSSNWVVGRGLCMYRREDFTAVPRGRRRAALDFKLPLWSPFEHTGYHAAWRGGVAMVWFWDSDKVASARAESATRVPTGGDRTPRPRILPETVFYERKPDGLYLQPCVEGFEIQYWRADVLADSFWFPEEPQASQLSWFLARQVGDADASSLAAGEMPAAASGTMAPEPWPVSADPREWLASNQRLLAAACLLPLVVVLLWQEARYWKIRHLEGTAARGLDTLQAQLTPIFEARRSLLNLRRTNLALLDALREPSQARLMDAVDRAIPSPDAEFREWRYQRGELSVLIEDRNPDPISYIRSLEALPLFDQVKAKPHRNRDRVEFTLKVRE